MTHLAPLVANDAFAKLKDRVFQPARDPALPPHANIFEVMRKQDVLLHHPYESFDPIVELIESAAQDPQVLAIKITLYRTSGDSPIVEALIDAANAGKQVTALVELRARFDEAANIQWARRLEEAGAHVVYGVVGLKTHCKALLIVRRDADRLRQYVHLGTGNYHPRTARIYTDFSLFTTNPKLTEEVAIVFNTLTGLAGYPGLEKLLVAPFDLQQAPDRLDRTRARPRARPGKPAPDRGQAQFARRSGDHRKTLRSLLRRRENRSDRARHLLPAPEDPRPERKHSRHQHRRPIPRTQPHLLFRKRRQSGCLSRQRRLDAAKFFSPRRDRFPDRSRRRCATKSSTKFCRVS